MIRAPRKALVVTLATQLNQCPPRAFAVGCQTAVPRSPQGPARAQFTLTVAVRDLEGQWTPPG
ncbi:hypothetical protein BH23CHL7_BH23CHL7_15210 [soil metagenome]